MQTLITKTKDHASAMVDYSSFSPYFRQSKFQAWRTNLALTWLFLLINGSNVLGGHLALVGCSFNGQAELLWLSIPWIMGGIDYFESCRAKGYLQFWSTCWSFSRLSFLTFCCLFCLQLSGHFDERKIEKMQRIDARTLWCEYVYNERDYDWEYDAIDEERDVIPGLIWVRQVWRTKTPR